MFHHRAPFVNHRHRFQTAGIFTSFYPAYTRTLFLYLHMMVTRRRRRPRKKAFSANAAFRFLTSADMCGLRLFLRLLSFFASFFFLISRIYFLCRRICILTKGPRKKVINKKHLGTNTRLKIGSNEGRASCKRRNYSLRGDGHSFCSVLKAAGVCIINSEAKETLISNVYPAWLLVSKCYLQNDKSKYKLYR